MYIIFPVSSDIYVDIYQKTLGNISFFQFLIHIFKIIYKIVCTGILYFFVLSTVQCMHISNFFYRLLPKNNWDLSFLSVIHSTSMSICVQDYE